MLWVMITVIVIVLMVGFIFWVATLKVEGKEKIKKGKRLKTDKKKLLIITCVISVLIIIGGLISIFIINNNNWKNRFELSDIESSTLSQTLAGNYSVSGKIKNISKEQYKNVYVIVEFTTHNGDMVEDKINIGKLTYGEEKNWTSKSISHWDYKIKEVLYEIQ